MVLVCVYPFRPLRKPKSFIIGPEQCVIESLDIHVGECISTLQRTVVHEWKDGISCEGGLALPSDSRVSCGKLLFLLAVVRWGVKESVWQCIPYLLEISMKTRTKRTASYEIRSTTCTVPTTNDRPRRSLLSAMMLRTRRFRIDSIEQMYPSMTASLHVLKHADTPATQNIASFLASGSKYSMSCPW